VLAPACAHLCTRHVHRCDVCTSGPAFAHTCTRACPLARSDRCGNEKVGIHINSHGCQCMHGAAWRHDPRARLAPEQRLQQLPGHVPVEAAATLLALGEPRQAGRSTIRRSGSGSGRRRMQGGYSVVMDAACGDSSVVQWRRNECCNNWWCCRTRMVLLWADGASWGRMQNYDC